MNAIRLPRVTAAAAIAVLLLASAPAHAMERAAAVFPAPAGTISADAGASYLRALRAVESGTQVETSPLGDVLFASREDPEPRAMGAGVQVTFISADLDEDGDDELVQLRGTFSRPRIVVADAATGAPLWEQPLPTPNFLLRLVPAATGSDVLVITGSSSGFAAEKRAGTTGALQWRRELPNGGVLFLLGITPAGDGHDLVVGVPFVWAPQVGGFDVEYRSLTNGQRTGGVELAAEGQYPTAALAGDLDGDGVGDLFAYEPVYLFGAGTSGTVRALTSRGTEEHWATAFFERVADYTYLIAGADTNGDGTRDPVLLSDFLGVFGSGETSTITVVNGKGGALAGTQPLGRVALRSYAQVFTAPSDVNGDGTEELVFSGAVYNYTSRAGQIVFEAVGRNLVWRTSVDYPAGSVNEFGYAWYPRAGDLDGDGVEDAIAIVGTRSAPVEAVAVSHAGGAHLWRDSGLSGRFPLPAHADLDGNGTDDLFDQLHVDAPTFSTRRVSFNAVGGADHALLWSHERTVKANRYQINAIGARASADSAWDDVVVEYNDLAGRHFAESLEGPTGAVNWTDP